MKILGIIFVDEDTFLMNLITGSPFKKNNKKTLRFDEGDKYVIRG